MGARENPWMAVAVMLALCPAVAVAQQSSQSSSAQPAKESSAAQDQKTKPVKAKSAKVWTDDDILSVRTPADKYIDRESVQSPAAAAATNQQQPPAAGSAKADKPALLSNPKTVEDADKMIAWEQKDIDSQQEYLEQLKQQLESTPPDQKAHIQAWIDQEIDTIAKAKKEQAGLEAQKQELEKKAASNNTASGKLPPQ